MGQPEIERKADVVRLDRSDYARVGRVLGAAFRDDPLWSVIVPDLDTRVRMFKGLARTIDAARGMVDGTPGLEGAALWLGPGREIGLGAVIRSGFAPASWVLRLPSGHLKHMLALQRQVETRHEKLILRPHWQLMVLGVAPEHHGQGYGTALVEAGLERADRDRRPVYVDTSAEANVGFYERFGFEVVDELTIAHPQVPFWMMVRSSP